MKKLVLIALVSALAAILPAAGASAAPATQARVIVELNAGLNATPVQIASTTDAVLSTLPTGSFTVNNRYSTLPYVALSAGPTALSVLRASGLVVAIHDDEVVSAASKKKKCKAGKKSKKSKKSCKKR